MKTFNFILWDEEGNNFQVDVNAETEEEAWHKIESSNIEYTCINLLP